MYEDETLLDEKIKKTIADFFKINIELVNNDLTVGDIQQWDSLGHIGLITHIEKEFDISIDVDHIVDIISEILGE